MVEIFANLWLALAAADTACAESGRDYKDGAIVLQVVRTVLSLDGTGILDP